MSAYLVLVHSQEDVAQLEGAAHALKKLGAKRILVLSSPAIVINQEEASSTLDAEIAEILKAERAAADRGDYEAAAGYKRTRDEKTLDRAATIANAWKTLPAEQQSAAMRRIFTPFVNILNPSGKSEPTIRFTKHQDHYDVQNWMAMLQSMASVWPKELVPGDFAMVWPGQLAGLNLSAETPRQEAPKVEPSKPKTREEELRSMKFMSLKSAATKAGVAVEGKKTSQIIAEILEAEKAQPASV